jgi:hypothetical protein
VLIQMSLTPTMARPCGVARAIASRVAWYMPIIPLWWPPSSADTAVSRTTRTGSRLLEARWSATLRSFGSPSTVAAQRSVDDVARSAPSAS